MVCCFPHYLAQYTYFAYPFYYDNTEFDPRKKYNSIKEWIEKHNKFINECIISDKKSYLIIEDGDEPVPVGWATRFLENLIYYPEDHNMFYDLGFDAIPKKLYEMCCTVEEGVYLYVTINNKLLTLAIYGDAMIPY